MTWDKYIKKGPNGTLTGLAVPVNENQADVCFSKTEFLSYRLKGPDGISFLHVSHQAQ